jgi:regulator of protease activity HflC (stomatin/prohibitin superfamily)
MSAFFTVPQSCCAVVERMGRFARVAREGLRIKLPVFEDFHRVPHWGKVANRYGWLIELSEQQTDTPVRECQTKDNVDLRAGATVFWKITDAAKAVYETDNLPAFVQNVALNALRAQIGSLELDEVFSTRQSLNQRIAAELAETGDKWGVAFLRVEIQELTVRDETAAAMRQQMEAERRRRATVADSEGQAQAEVRLAEAQKQAAILRAEGRAKALHTIAEAEATYLESIAASTSPAAAAQLLLAQKYLEGYEIISAKPGNKVFLPNTAPMMMNFNADDADTGQRPERELLRVKPKASA